MSQTEMLNNATDIICGLKSAVAFLECQHNAFLKQKQIEEVQKQPSTYVIVPTCDNVKKHVPRNKPKKCKPQPPEQKVEQKIEKIPNCPPKYKSPEMKMSYLQYKCFCLHRNGLQDECPLTGCKGQPECLVQPWPVCPAGKFYRARNPELYPTISQNKK